jgi:hypothetical protein
VYALPVNSTHRFRAISNVHEFAPWESEHCANLVGLTLL